MTEWYRAVHGSIVGPLSEDELQAEAKNGQLGPADLVWKAGLERWMPARDVLTLFMPPPLPREPDLQSVHSSPQNSAPPLSQPPVIPIGSGVSNAQGQQLQVAALTSQPALPIRWLNFWTWVRLPLGGLLSVLISIALAVRGNDEPLAIIFALLVSIGIFLFSMYLALGLWRRRLWAWRTNWALLVIDWLLYSMEAPPSQTEPSALRFAVKFLFFGLVWFLPNYIYFTKRRVMFS